MIQTAILVAATNSAATPTAASGALMELKAGPPAQLQPHGNVPRVLKATVSVTVDAATLIPTARVLPARILPAALTGVMCAMGPTVWLSHARPSESTNAQETPCPMGFATAAAASRIRIAATRDAQNRDARTTNAKCATMNSAESYLAQQPGLATRPCLEMAIFVTVDAVRKIRTALARDAPRQAARRQPATSFMTDRVPPYSPRPGPATRPSSMMVVTVTAAVVLSTPTATMVVQVQAARHLHVTGVG